MTDIPIKAQQRTTDLAIHRTKMRISSLLHHINNIPNLYINNPEMAKHKEKAFEREVAHEERILSVLMGYPPQD